MVVLCILMGDQLALADASNASILLEQSSGSFALSLAAVLLYMTKNIVILGYECIPLDVGAASNWRRKDDVRPIGSELS